MTDLVVEANNNSALFNTMQQALDVYNPLMHKARPTIVNQSKHRFRVQPTSWGNTMNSWSGSRMASFPIPRIASLTGFNLKVAFRIPGDEPTATERTLYGNRGKAKTSLTRGTITNNKNEDANNARGRLDRVYADSLLGFTMIQKYSIVSKSRTIFTGTGEYLLVRFSQLDESQKLNVSRSITPVEVMSPNPEDAFYAPATTYEMAIPLFTFIEEHISNSLDVNFTEDVRIEITFKAPSELFYYGQLGDLNYVPALKAAGKVGHYQLPQHGVLGEDSGLYAWDQSTTGGSRSANDHLTKQQASTFAITAAGTERFGTANIGNNVVDADVFASPIETANSVAMNTRALQHIQGVAPPWDFPTRTDTDPGTINGRAPLSRYYGTADFVTSGPTFSYPNVDSNGESIQIQLELNADFIVQNTDAYRALRASTFPEGSGLTQILHDVATERFSNLFASSSLSNNLLDVKSGGSFVDPSQNPSGITIGDSTRYVDIQLRNNNLVFATHFMVRKHSDMGGDHNSNPTTVNPISGKDIPGSLKVLGAHQIHTRLLPVHYFQVLSANRVIYESDAKTHLNLTQSSMYPGTGSEWGTKASNLAGKSNWGMNTNRLTGKPFNVYSLNWGLQASRIEDTGCVSFQNTSNPTLRIYFKPDTYGEYGVELYTGVVGEGAPAGASEAKIAASYGVQVDVIHEFRNVVTINSGNGEITSGLNQ